MTEAPTPRRRTWRFRLVAFAVASLLALLAVEVAVRVVAPQPLSGTWRDWADGYPVNRAGATARHQFRDHVVVYRFDEHGLRGAPARPDAFRVLVLGDSFTFGWLLPDEETYVGRMQAAADAAHGPGRVAFLNGGVGGGNTAASLAFLEDRGGAVAPDAVLCFLNCWDVGRALQSGLYEARPDGTLERRRPEAPVSGFSRSVSRIPGYAWLLEHSHLVQLVRNVAARASAQEAVLGEGGRPAASPPPKDAAAAPPAVDPELDRRAVAYGQALYRRMKAWCDERRVPLWVVTTGRPYERPADGSRTRWGHLEATLAFVEQAPGFFRELGTPFADTTPAVSAECGGDFRRLVIPGEGHPDAAGAALIGRHAWAAVGPWLAEALGRRR